MRVIIIFMLTTVLFLQSCIAQKKSRLEEPTKQQVDKNDTKTAVSKQFYCAVLPTYTKTIKLLTAQNELLRNTVMTRLEDDKKVHVAAIQNRVKEKYDYLEEVLSKFVKGYSKTDLGNLCFVDFRAEDYDINYWKEKISDVNDRGINRELDDVRKSLMQSLIEMKGKKSEYKIERILYMENIDEKQMENFDSYAVILQIKDWQIQVLELETQSLTFLLDKVELTYDKFEIFNEVNSNVIKKGETFESLICLGAYSSQAKFSASINDNRMKIIDGKINFKATGMEVGKKSYEVKISIVNPLTDRVETVTRTYFYTVIE
ncbi:MAG: hypothetical protein GY810_14900 [Aureispira sp.]|nr:hypothetical protein [Aureispira sp.]